MPFLLVQQFFEVRILNEKEKFPPSFLVRIFRARDVILHLFADSRLIRA